MRGPRESLEEAWGISARLEALGGESVLGGGNQAIPAQFQVTSDVHDLDEDESEADE